MSITLTLVHIMGAGQFCHIKITIRMKKDLPNKIVMKYVERVCVHVHSDVLKARAHVSYLLKELAYARVHVRSKEIVCKQIAQTNVPAHVRYLLKEIACILTP